MKKLNINGNLYYNLTDLVRSDYLMIVQITRHPDICKKYYNVLSDNDLIDTF